MVWPELYRLWGRAVYGVSRSVRAYPDLRQAYSNGCGTNDTVMGWGIPVCGNNGEKDISVYCMGEWFLMFCMGPKVCICILRGYDTAENRPV